MTDREALRNAHRQYDLAQAESRRWQLAAQVSDKQEDWNKHIAAQKDVLHWGLQASRHAQTVSAA